MITMITTITMITALAAASLVACTRPNPAFDDSDSAAASEDPGATLAVTGLTGEPVTSTLASAESSTGIVDPTGASSTTTTDVSGTTGAPVCAKIGESCGLCCGCGVCSGGICLPDNSQCGTCGECQQAICVPAAAGAGCIPAEPDTCSDKFWGLMDGDCYAQGPLLGTCDDQQACNAQPCGSQGAVLVDCDASCIKDPDECIAGQPAKFDAMKLCAFAGQTTDCGTRCEANVNGDITHISSCHAGLCQEDQMIPCGNYKCRDDLKGCQTDCKDSTDCLLTKVCVNGVCTP